MSVMVMGVDKALPCLVGGASPGDILHVPWASPGQNFWLA